MGAIFALSTPLGVAIGLGIQATYNEHSPNSLGVQGVFDSLSAGTPLNSSLACGRSLHTCGVAKQC